MFAYRTANISVGSVVNGCESAATVNDTIRSMQSTQSPMKMLFYVTQSTQLLLLAHTRLHILLRGKQNRPTEMTQNVIDVLSAHISTSYFFRLSIEFCCCNMVCAVASHCMIVAMQDGLVLFMNNQRMPLQSCNIRPVSVICLKRPMTAEPIGNNSQRLNISWKNNELIPSVWERMETDCRCRM